MIRFLCAAAATVGFASTPITAQVRVELILDASEEMQSELDGGQTGFSAARQAIAAWISEETPGLLVGLGLTVMGGGASEPGGDGCQHHMLVEPGSSSMAAWSDAIDAIEPAGPRPLVETVASVARRLTSTSSPGYLVVVTSGGEGCGGDPEVATAALDDEVAMRLVGVGLDDHEVGLFSAIAPTRNAKDALSLLEALRSTALDIAAEHTLLEVPAEVTAGRQFEVAWSGPEAEADFVSIAEPEAEDSRYLNLHLVEAGSPAVLPAPIDPGVYEIRYVDGRSGRVLRRVLVEAVAAPLVLKGPAEVQRGQRFEISWTGPNAEGDFIAIAPAGSPDRRHLDWVYASHGSPATLASPLRVGDFEIRYLSGATGEVLAAVALKVKR